MYEHILVPLDGSDLAEEVLPYAKEMVRAFAGDIVLFHAVMSLAEISAKTGEDAGSGTETPETVAVASQQLEAMTASGHEYLAAVTGGCSARASLCGTHQAEGAPARAILDYANANGITLIAMSTHGRGGLGRLVFGSVADEVLRHSHIPILLIRSGDQATPVSR